MVLGVKGSDRGGSQRRGLRVKGSDRRGEASPGSLLEEVNPFFLFLAFDPVHLFPLVANSGNHQSVLFL